MVSRLSYTYKPSSTSCTPLMSDLNCTIRSVSSGVSRSMFIPMSRIIVVTSISNTTSTEPKMSSSVMPADTAMSPAIASTMSERLIVPPTASSASSSCFSISERSMDSDMRVLSKVSTSPVRSKEPYCFTLSAKFFTVPSSPTSPIISSSSPLISSLSAPSN